jgi:hypothetical protein
MMNQPPSTSRLLAAALAWLSMMLMSMVVVDAQTMIVRQTAACATGYVGKIVKLVQFQSSNMVQNKLPFLTFFPFFIFKFRKFSFVDRPVT